MIYDVTLFGIHFYIDPIAFTLPIGKNGWSIYWYGILMATGFLLAMIYGLYNAERFGVNKDRMIDVVMIATPCSILAARTYYVLFDGVPCRSIADFFGFSGSSGIAGIGMYGSLIGAFASGVVICKIFKIKLLDMFDLASMGFLIGQTVGRWGNFVNQEAYGSFTGSDWWGMESNRTIAEMGEGLVHPCFLYESLWCLLGVIIIHKLSKKRHFSGETFLMYCAWYGFARGFIEILRTDSLMIGNIKVSCLLAFLLFIVCTTLIIVLRKKVKPEAEYIAVFSENEEVKEVESNEID